MPENKKPKPTPAKAVLLNNTTWNQDVLLVWGGTKRSRAASIKRKIGAVPDDYCEHESQGTMWASKDGGVIISINYWNWTSEGVSVLAHECLHATFECLRRSGVKHCWKTEEAFCYLHSWMVKQCLSAILDAK